MNLLKKILGELTVAVVRFADAERFETTVYTVRCTKRGADVSGLVADTEKEAAVPKDRPVLLVATGHGVIARRGVQASAVADKVMAEPEKFVWNPTGTGTDLLFSFMRREQLAGAVAALEAQGAGIVRISCSAADRPEDAAKETAAAFGRESVRWKGLFRPTEPGAQLAGVVVRRLRLPILAMLLVLLAGNSLLRGCLQQRCAALQARCTVLQQQQGEAGRLSDEKRRALDDFRRRAPYRFGMLCDRIGKQVPPEVMLDGLQLLPFGETGGNAKKPDRTPPEVRIMGRSSSAEAIAGFLSGLQSEAFASGAVLQSVEQGRESGVFTFSIDVPL